MDNRRPRHLQLEAEKVVRSGGIELKWNIGGAVRRRAFLPNDCTHVTATECSNSIRLYRIHQKLLSCRLRELTPTSRDSQELGSRNLGQAFLRYTM